MVYDKNKLGSQYINPNEDPKWAEGWEDPNIKEYKE